jgi:CelD/BcsL family acetyltransferase involved in cellulose biosynthesis
VKNEYSVTVETFNSVSSYWLDTGLSLKWDCLFVLPPWMKAWWQAFGTNLTSYFCVVRCRQEIIGIAPLLLEGGEARIIGDVEVCDYLDFIAAPGREKEFFRMLFLHLREEGITRLDLRPLHANSTLLTVLVSMIEELGCEISIDEEDVSLELDLPETWEGFLGILTGKERHEIRRKLRRLHEAAEINFKVVDDVEAVEKSMETFLELFNMNRPDKAEFMTDRMTFYFRQLAKEMAEARILKLFFLELDTVPAAATMCFDYKETRYLYNNGYDSRYRALSVGLLSKVLSIEDSIRCGKKKYDFLKGAEIYKSRLGGKPINVQGCRIELV